MQHNAARYLTFYLALFVSIVPAGAAQPLASGSDEMSSAARNFVATLDEAQREKTVFPFSHEERYNFHFIPRERRGLSLKEMNLEQRRAAHDLVRSALSARGYLKATSIMQLEEVLDAIEDSGPIRDSELYFVSVFGSPDGDEPWGWRFEGHHLSLNYTSATDELTATTPAFFGANPAEVRTGPSAGLRVLASEEDLARMLMASLDPTQRSIAIIAETAPSDIITGADRQARLDQYEGLPAAEMTEAQRELLWQLIRTYTHNMRGETADRQLERIRAGGLDSLCFAWAGSLERGAGHYYRIHGPSVLIEYDNTQNEANHIHTVWRDLDNDFGGDLLRKHYEEHRHE